MTKYNKKFMVVMATLTFLFQIHCRHVQMQNNNKSKHFSSLVHPSKVAVCPSQSSTPPPMQASYTHTVLVWQSGRNFLNSVLRDNVHSKGLKGQLDKHKETMCFCRMTNPSGAGTSGIWKFYCSLCMKAFISDHQSAWFWSESLQ